MTISGTVEAGATVTVKMGGTTLPVTVTGTTWSCPVSRTGGRGQYRHRYRHRCGGECIAPGRDHNLYPPRRDNERGKRRVSIGDALKALRIAVGIIQPSSDDLLHGDVAPPGAPDDRIDVATPC